MGRAAAVRGCGILSALVAAALAAALPAGRAAAQTSPDGLPPGAAGLSPEALLMDLRTGLLGLGGTVLDGPRGAGLFGGGDPDDPDGAADGLGGLLPRMPAGLLPPEFRDALAPPGGSAVPGIAAPTVAVPGVTVPGVTAPGITPPLPPLDAAPLDPDDPVAMQRALAAEILRLGRIGARSLGGQPFDAEPFGAAAGALLPGAVLPGALPAAAPPPAPDAAARPTGISREERRAMRRMEMQQRWEEWRDRPVRRLPMAQPIGR